MTSAFGSRPDQDAASLMPVLWTDCEPARLLRDQREVRAFAPLLEFHTPSPDGWPHGGWTGLLPRWPFTRPQPQALDELLGKDELEVAVYYSAAYPMVPPTIHARFPAPTLEEETQSAWHVAPGGALCLLQSDAGWHPEASLTDLLAKACGWRIEYALMKAAVIDKMSVHGIVSDASHDHLIEQAVQYLPALQTPSREDAPDAKR